MASLLTEMYSLSVPTGDADCSVLDRSERMAGLPWDRKGSLKDLLGGGSCQQHKQQQLLQGGTRVEHRLGHGGHCAAQGSLEVGLALRQEGKGQEPPQQGGELLVQKKRLDSGSWQLDFESQSDCEEIHWGCFYFFPWLRMWRRVRRERL
ncbi:uncharacterized protein LOC143842011 [Paroedura picta]|uniref:uncharacterized protein LOC143842011 n=1 Tax=Paroedura picta TaxID=143630 RepID=UPI004056F4C5